MTPQEAAEQYANEHWGDNYITENKAHDEKAFIAGQQWQSEQDNQALSSALKEIAELHAKVKELQQDVEHNAKRAIEIAKERDELNADVKRMESIIGELTKENNQMKFWLQLIIGFDDSSIYSDPGEIAQEYLPKKYQ